jgi:hypothetical protein
MTLNMIRKEVKFLVSNIRYKEVNDINLLTKYYWATDVLLKRITFLEKEDNLLSRESKSKLHICKETVWSLRCSIRYRISKIMKTKKI